jgi:hypothetical protein
VNLKTNAERSFLLCSMFESEVFVWLLMDQWQHPFTDDDEYRANLLENAAAVLDSARSGATHEFIAGLPPKDMNLIAAIWYAESCAFSEEATNSEKRDDWLRNIRRKFPSCFCDSDQFL